MTENNPEHQPVTHTLVRFGVPALILIFYIAATLRFDYTPDTTFAMLLSLQHAAPESLWGALLSLAGPIGIDRLVAAKVFSLFFSCFAILFSYLIANEVLRDQLNAFYVAMAVALQSWLMQLAPSGSGVCFLLVLILAAIFFLLRNEYLLGAVLAGAASLVAWQGAGLLVALICDAFVNSVSKARSTKIITSIVLVYLGAILPWILYGLYIGAPFLPNEIANGNLPTLVPQVAFEAVMLVGLMFVGIVLLAMRDRELLRQQTAVVLWVVLASFSHEQMFLLTLPLVLMYAFLAIRKIAESVNLATAQHLLAGMFVAGILAYNQFVVHPAVHKSMDERIAETVVMRANAEWLRVNAAENESVSVPAGYEGMIQYYSEKEIGGGGSLYIIARDTTVADAEVVFDPSKLNPELLTNHFTVWKRK